MATTNNPLAVLDFEIEDIAGASDFDEQREYELRRREFDFRQARAAVAELVATGRRAEVMFNTVRGCYERNPGNFAVAMREFEREVADFRAALAAFEVTP